MICILLCLFHVLFCLWMSVYCFVYVFFFYCLCLFFFFFKQKTAYEMRISDWSSDVCSSDLIHRWPSSSLSSAPRISSSRPLKVPSNQRAGALRKQIGRASCRERVCQYV